MVERPKNEEANFSAFDRTVTAHENGTSHTPMVLNHSRLFLT
jgi:hypothetical protein